jgi:HlyD family secretion protein
VVDVRVARGNLVATGTGLLSLEQPERSLGAVLYLPPIEGTKIQPGMEVRLSPASVKREEHGLLLGRVSAVSAFPATTSGMRRVLGSDELAKGFSAGAPPIEVQVELVRNPTTISGYEWTSTLSTLASFVVGLAPEPLMALLPGWATPQGPPITLASGTVSTAEIVTEQQAPIYLVLAKLNW